ncbi:ABC-three component system middle component 1 [Enterococcus durans]|uniref:ABC-three component system middle component 1 n=2 Tax=Enterococcus durans TaxID=53345 RepID=UPI0039A510DD
MKELYSYDEHKVFSKIENLKCFTCEQGIEKYNIYLFSYQFNDEKELLENYEKINDVIAFGFQSELKKNIEKWNVYFFLFVSNNTSNTSKVLVEQNKYATRKIVIEKSPSSLSEQKKIIKEKLFLEDFENLSERNKFNKTVEIDSEGDVYNLLEKLRNDSIPNKKKEISGYLKEVMKYES